MASAALDGCSKLVCHLVHDLLFLFTTPKKFQTATFRFTSDSWYKFRIVAGMGYCTRRGGGSARPKNMLTRHGNTRCREKARVQPILTRNVLFSDPDGGGQLVCHLLHDLRARRFGRGGGGRGAVYVRIHGRDADTWTVSRRGTRWGPFSSGVIDVMRIAGLPL